jgi:hypothetical protein
MATPYVISSDLVSAYPAKSLEIAQYIDGFKADLALVQNAQTGTTYTLAAADFTKLVTLSNASPVAVTLPLEVTVPWPAGTTLRLLNQGAGTVTVAGAVGVTINGTPLTLAQYKGAALIKTGTNTWTFAPFSSGVGAADFSDAATGTYTGFKYLTFSSGSGTLTVTTAGFADIVVCGGGGGGSTDSGGGGGAGGVLVVTNAYLPVGTLTVSVGAGGAGATGAGTEVLGKSGNGSRIGSYFALGGGPGGNSNYSLIGFNGGSGGGGSFGAAGGSGITDQGNSGGASASTSAQGAGGGGGAGGAGAAGTTSVGGAGGAGTTTSIAGTTPTGAYVAGSYALGGGGGGGCTSGTAGTGGSGGGGNGTASGTATAGAANTGGGGGGSGRYAIDRRAAGNGGSGIVIIRVAV